MKKLILSAILLISAWQTIAAVDDEVVVDGVVYVWNSEQGGYIASYWDQTTPINDLIIHNEVNELDVVGIADNAFNFSNDYNYYREKTVIENLVIEEGVKKIGLNAFVDCSFLRTAIIPGSVTEIGDAAFFRCSSLKTLSLNEGLIKIAEEAFAECTGLNTVVVPSSVRYIGSQAFLYCTGVTDAYFLMEASVLSDFDWYDGTIEHNGGTEFNTVANTTIHVPQGLLQDYIDSGKFSAWLSNIEEDDRLYPLWWIVNFGTVGTTYTVSDDLTAVYTDINGKLYCKDNNMWLTPDVAQEGEYDYMSHSGLLANRGNVYDQSNWVALSGITSPGSYNGYTINGSTITGVLRDKYNPVIEVTSTPVKGDATTYIPNTYIPASVMSRTQEATDGTTYAFVRPKPQEYAKYDWTIYYTNNEFYVPAPEGQMNHGRIKGGLKAYYDLYETPPVPSLQYGGLYPFHAITRRTVASGNITPSGQRRRVTPYYDGGLTKVFDVFPLELPANPITAVTDIRSDENRSSIRYNLLGQPVDENYKGFVIENGQKMIVK